MRGGLILLGTALLGITGAGAAVGDPPSIPGAIAAVDKPVTSVTGEGTPKPPDRIIVVWQPNVAPNERLAVRSDAGIESATTLGRSRFQVLVPEDGQTVQAALTVLNNDPTVASAERDSYAELHGTTNDPRLSELWGLKTTAAGIDALSAWDKTPEIVP